MVARAFCDGGYDGDVVTLGADVVGRGDDGDVDVCYGSVVSEKKMG